MLRRIPDPPRQGGDPPAEPGMPDRLRSWLGATRAGAAVQLGTLELTPLLNAPGAPSAEPALLLHEALRAGGLEIVEQGGGVVNEVVARSTGHRAVLMLEGESIVGAKQNRVVTLDVLIGPGCTVTVPVGCVERGRWGHAAGGFGSAASPVDPSIRAKTVNEMSTLGMLNQARLWSDVSMKLMGSGVASQTGDYHAFVRKEFDAASSRARSVAVLPGQVGVLAVCDGQLVGCDLVGHPLHWIALAERLITSYVFAAAGPARTVVAAGGADAGPAGRNAEGWLRAIVGARIEARPALALGTQVALAGGGLAGSGLWHGDAPAHLAVFAAGGDAGPGPGVQPNPHWTVIR
jgi:hypothetical protein